MTGNQKLPIGQTVDAGRMTYDIQLADDNDGSKWVVITQKDTLTDRSQQIHIPGDKIQSIFNTIFALRDQAYRFPDTPTDRCSALSSLRGVDRNAKKAWGNGEEALLLHLYAENHSVETITATLGRSYFAVTARLGQLGVHPDWAMGQYG